MVIITKEDIENIIHEIIEDYHNKYAISLKKNKLYTPNEFGVILTSKFMRYVNLYSKSLDLFKSILLVNINNFALDELKKANREINTVYENILSQYDNEPKYLYSKHHSEFYVLNPGVINNNVNVYIINEWIKRSIKNMGSIRTSYFIDKKNNEYSLPYEFKEVIEIIRIEKDEVFQKIKYSTKISMVQYFIILLIILFMVIIFLLLLLIF